MVNATMNTSTFRDAAKQASVARIDKDEGDKRICANYKLDSYIPFLKL